MLPGQSFPSLVFSGPSADIEQTIIYLGSQGHTHTHTHKHTHTLSLMCHACKPAPMKADDQAALCVVVALLAGWMSVGPPL